MNAVETARVFQTLATALGQQARDARKIADRGDEMTPDARRAQIFAAVLCERLGAAASIAASAVIHAHDEAEARLGLAPLGDKR